MAEGGCLCGAVRYRVEGTAAACGLLSLPHVPAAAGAPVVAWATWPAERFTWLQGEARTFASSAKGERCFCATCSSSLAFVDPAEPGFIELTLASLDDPAVFPPEEHIWTSSRVRWLDLGDELPRYPGAR